MYIIIAIVTLIFSIILFKKASGSMELTKLNMISWIFYYVFVLQAFMSSLLVIHNLDFHFLISKIGNPDARLMGFYSVQYMMLAVPAGMVLANQIFSFKPQKEFLLYQQKELVPIISRYDSYIRYPLYFLCFVSFIAVLYTFYTIRTFPLLKMFSGADALVLGTLRSEAKAGFEGSSLIRNVFGITLTPILCYIAYGYYKLTGSFNDKIWFIIMTILSVLILTYNLEKAPVGFFLIGFYFFKVLYDGRVSKKTLMYLFFVLIGLFIFLYSFLSSSFEISGLFDFRTGILGRIFLGQSAGLYLTFDTFPQTFDFLGFSSMSENITSFLQIENQERLGKILIQRYNPAAVDLGTAGVVNSFFIAEAWANFGWTGWIIGPFYVGFLIQIMYIFFLKVIKTPLTMGLFVYYSYKGGISGGFNEYIYNPNIMLILLVMIFVYSYAKYLKIVIR